MKACLSRYPRSTVWRVAVGTEITPRPPHRLYVRLSRIQLLPRVSDGESLFFAVSRMRASAGDTVSRL
jgi:hypothetical protein